MDLADSFSSFWMVHLAYTLAILLASYTKSTYSKLKSSPPKRSISQRREELSMISSLPGSREVREVDEYEGDTDSKPEQEDRKDDSEDKDDAFEDEAPTTPTPSTSNKDQSTSSTFIPFGGVFLSPTLDSY
ncbi:hypothetical protein T439DRAFT_328645 [Meredithblackwellia eburnea MCA 4105]